MYFQENPSRVLVRFRVIYPAPAPFSSPPIRRNDAPCEMKSSDFSGKTRLRVSPYRAKKWRRIKRQIRTILRLRKSFIRRISQRTRESKTRNYPLLKPHSPLLRGHKDKNRAPASQHNLWALRVFLNLTATYFIVLPLNVTTRCKLRRWCEVVLAYIPQMAE